MSAAGGTPKGICHRYVNVRNVKFRLKKTDVTVIPYSIIMMFIRFIRLKVIA